MGWLPGRVRSPGGKSARSRQRVASGHHDRVQLTLHSLTRSVQSPNGNVDQAPRYRDDLFARYCLEQDGELVAGVVYNPVHGELFAAEKGKGAWLQKDSGKARQLHVSHIKQLQESLLSTGFPSHKRHANPNIHFYQQLTLRSHGVRRAGAAAPTRYGMA